MTLSLLATHPPVSRSGSTRRPPVGGTTTRRKAHHRLVLALLLPLVLAATPSVLPAAPNAPRPRSSAPLVFAALRVETLAKNQAMYDLLLDYLRDAGIDVYPRMVFGSYLDLVEWIIKGQVDLALLPPQVYIEARNRRPDMELIATALRGIPPQPLSPTYGSVLVSRITDGVRSVEDLAGKMPCFVNELSTSGYLIPRLFLESRGVRLPPAPQWSGSHQASLERLLRPREATGVDYVAVANLALGSLPAGVRERLRVFPVVDAAGAPLPIPNDSVVARPDLPAELKDRVRQVLLELGGSTTLPAQRFLDANDRTAFEVHPDALYDSVRSIARHVLDTPDRHDIGRVLESIRRDIDFESELAAAQGETYEPRIALVFSGGGAAGAFQAGAAIEVDRAMRRAGLAPQIVVGSSVGAINGAAVALGRAEALTDLWGQLDLDDVLTVHPEDRPLGWWKLGLLRMVQRTPILVEAMILLLAGFVFLHLFLVVCRVLPRGALTRTVLFVLVATPALLIYGKGSTILPVPLACFGAALILDSWRPLDRLGRRLRSLVIVADLAFLGLLGILVPCELDRAFLTHEALFSSEPLRRTLGRHFLRLRGVPVPDDGELRDAVGAESRRLVEARLPRTLVLSTTDYHRQQERYFYVTGDPRIEELARSRGYTSIAEACPESFIDIIVASASVFPVLDPFVLELASGERLKLIDGAYVHNNPVQVALDLGATHVLVLKPSVDTDAIESDHSLLGSLYSALGLLITRSQTEDLKAREAVMSFLIGPAPAPSRTMLGPLEFDGRFEELGFGRSRRVYSLRDFLEEGRRAVHSEREGFEIWSRGTFKLPPLVERATAR